MNRTCSLCGKALESVGYGPDWMNSYQWDAVKAGDYFAKCEKASHPNGNCYFWKRSETAVALSPSGRSILDGGREP